MTAVRGTIGTMDIPTTGDIVEINGCPARVEVVEFHHERGHSTLVVEYHFSEAIPAGTPKARRDTRVYNDPPLPDGASYLE